VLKITDKFNVNTQNRKVLKVQGKPNGGSKRTPMLIHGVASKTYNGLADP
jgi:hypothetical protein